MPNKLQELIGVYKAYAEEMEFIELPLDYEWAAEMTINTFLEKLLLLYLESSTSYYSSYIFSCCYLVEDGEIVDSKEAFNKK